MVPVHLSDRILRDEYVDFDGLPDNLSDQTPGSRELQAATDDGAQRKLTINLGRPQVKSSEFLHSWLSPHCFYIFSI